MKPDELVGNTLYHLVIAHYAPDGDMAEIDIETIDVPIPDNGLVNDKYMARQLIRLAGEKYCEVIHDAMYDPLDIYMCSSNDGRITIVEKDKDHPVYDIFFHRLNTTENPNIYQYDGYSIQLSDHRFIAYIMSDDVNKNTELLRAVPFNGNRSFDGLNSCLKIIDILNLDNFRKIKPQKLYDRKEYDYAFCKDIMV